MERRENIQMPLKNALPTVAIVISLAVALFGNGIVSDGYDQTVQTNVSLATIKTTLTHQVEMQRLSLDAIKQVQADVQEHGMTLYTHNLRIKSLEQIHNKDK